MSASKTTLAQAEPGAIVRVEGKGLSYFKVVQDEGDGTIRLHEVNSLGTYQRVRFMRADAKCKKVRSR